MKENLLENIMAETKFSSVCGIVLHDMAKEAGAIEGDSSAGLVPELIAAERNVADRMLSEDAPEFESFGELLKTAATAGAVMAASWRSGQALQPAADDFMAAEEMLDKAFGGQSEKFFEAAAGRLRLMCLQADRETGLKGRLLHGAVRASAALGISMALDRPAQLLSAGSFGLFLYSLEKAGKDCYWITDAEPEEGLTAHGPATCASIADALSTACAEDEDGGVRRVLETCFYAGIEACWHYDSERNRRMIDAVGLFRTLTFEFGAEHIKTNALWVMNLMDEQGDATPKGAALVSFARKEMDRIAEELAAISAQDAAVAMGAALNAMFACGARIGAEFLPGARP